jgi:phosphate-selective porin OprO/OprP
MTTTALSNGKLLLRVQRAGSRRGFSSSCISVILDKGLLLLLMLWIGRSAEAQEAAPPTPAPADDNARVLREVLAEQERLRARLAAAEARLAESDAKHKNASVVQFNIGPNGFTLGTRDNAFQLRIRSVVQADGRAFLNEPQRQADTFLIRRARLYIEGTIGEHFDYRLMPDFSNGTLTLFDAWINVRFFRFLQVRVGKMKTPFSLERLQQEQFVTFNERSLVSQIAPDRDVGVALRGDAWDGALAWDVGVYNGVADGGNADFDTSYAKDYIVRVFSHPLRPIKNRYLRNIGLGLAYDYGKLAGTATATQLGNYRSGGQQNVFSWFTDSKNLTTAFAKGDHWRVNPQLYAYVGPVGFLAEYVMSSNDVSNGSTAGVVHNQAWNLQASVVLTLEDAGYDGVDPRRPFGVRKKGPGAFELAARISELRIDDRAFPLYADPNKSVKRALGWALQLNWFLTRNFRFGLMYERTIFDYGAAGATSGAFRPTENVLIGRLQASF